MLVDGTAVVGRAVEGANDGTAVVGTLVDGIEVDGCSVDGAKVGDSVNTGVTGGVVATVGGATTLGSHVGELPAGVVGAVVSSAVGWVSLSSILLKSRKRSLLTNSSEADKI